MTKLTKLEEKLIVKMHEISNGNSHEAERILRGEPYFSQYQDFTRSAVVNCWKRYNLPIRQRGGPNTLGRRWKCKEHNTYELAKICGLI